MPGSSYLVRRPIKDPGSRVIGYELVCADRLSGSAEESSPFAVSDAIQGFLARNGQKTLKGELSFLPCSTTFLMKKVPHLFAPQDLVVQIGEDVLTHPLAMHLVRQYREQGYRIAVDNFQFSPGYLELLDRVDEVRLDFQTISDVSLHNVLETAAGMDKRCIGTGIDNGDLYQRALSSGIQAMEGAYVSERTAAQVRGKGYLQSEFFRLLAQITADEVDIQQIERIITMDGAMNSAWMRIANSRYFAYGVQTSSVWQSLVKLGVGQLRELSCLLCAWSAKGTLDPDYEEYLTVSLVRANFCGKLTNYTRAAGVSRREAYLAGLFSTLPWLVDASIDAILRDVPLRDEIREALVNRQGPCGELLQLVLCYQAADWDQVDYLASRLEIPSSLLTNVYFECVEDARTLWRELDEESTETS